MTATINSLNPKVTLDGTEILEISEGGTGSFNTSISRILAYVRANSLQAPNAAMVSDGSGIIVSSVTTADEIGFVNGVTSAIQPQIDAKEDSANKGVANGYAPLNASSLVPIANLGTGTPDGTQFLRDDGTLAVPPSGPHDLLSITHPDTLASAVTEGGVVVGTDGFGGIRWTQLLIGPAGTVFTSDGVNANWQTPASSGHIIQNEGVDLPEQPRLNFTGNRVFAINNTFDNRTDVFIDAENTWKRSAELVATTNIATLSGEQTIDGVLTTFDRILLVGQTDQSENGVWITQGAGAWTRPGDFNATSVDFLAGAVIVITQGLVNKDTSWQLTTPAPIVIDTTDLVFLPYGIAGGENIASGPGIINWYDSVDAVTKLMQFKTMTVTQGIKITLASSTAVQLGVEIPDGQILIGDAGTNGLPQTVSGDATMSSTGVVTLDASIARNTDNLSFFANTTSAQLAGIIDDETGGGPLVFAGNPTLQETVTVVAEGLTADVDVRTYDGGGNGANFIGRSANGTIASPLVTALDDTLFDLTGYGWDGDVVAAWRRGGAVQIAADDDFSATSTPGRYSIFLTPTGSVNPTIRYKLSSDGEHDFIQGNVVGFNATDITNKIDANQVHIQVQNTSGAVLAKGDAVREDTWNVGLGRANVVLADANDPTPALGIVEEDISNGQTGLIVETGNLEDFDTSAFSTNQTIYLSTSGTTGNTLTNVRPTGTASIQVLGRIGRANPTNGVLNVFINSRYASLPNIASANFWLGNASGVATAVTMSGDATMDNAGVVTLTLPATVVQTDQTNTYTAGLTQTFPHSATNPGISLGDVAGTPSVLTDGSIWYNSTTNQFFGRANGANVDFGAAAAGVSDGDKGDITVSSGGTVWNIDAGAVGTTEIATNAVTTSELANNAVEGVNIAALAVTAAKIAAGTITSAQLAANSVGISQIGNAAVGTGELVDLAVTAAKIGNGVITATQLAANSVGASQIANNAVGTGELIDLAVSGAKLATNAVTTDKIAGNTITGVKLANATVTGSKMALLTVTSAILGTQAVTADKLATNAVTGTKIATAAVTGAKIAAGTITNANLGNGIVDADVLATNAVTGTKIATAAVTGAKIAALTITNANIANGTIGINQMATNSVGGSQIVAGSVTGGDIAATTITAANISNDTITAAQIATNAITTTELGNNAVNTANITDAQVTLAKMANIGTNSFIGRDTAGTGVPESLTLARATALLNLFTSALKGLVPASGGGTTNFLRADGVWAAP